MNNGKKIIVFIIVALLLSFMAIVLKEAGAGAVLSIAGLSIYILYQAMFKKSKPEENKSKDNEITLKK